MIRTLALGLALAISAATGAHATGGIYCDGARDGTVGAFLTVGRTPGFAVVGARITVPGNAFDLNAIDGAAPMVLAQGAILGDLIAADFTDPNAERVVASLRIVRSAEGNDVAAAGTLHLPGVGAWPVVCEID
jgi:hypothetical protein